MQSKYKVQFDKLKWVEPGDGIRYKCYQQENYQLRLVEFSKKMTHKNWCLKGHFAYVVAGRMELEFAETTEVYDTGDALFILEGEKHKHRPKALSEKVVFFSVEKI
jgi:quercetin dioxygenase-like cupin family protein